jgi:uncharacterized protein YqgV (UPF0045/DUF77 family)
MISCQFSLYPLGVESLSPAIAAAVAELKRVGLEPEVGPMSTYVAGETAAVFEGLRRAFEVAAAAGGIVMSVTLSNACPLPPSVGPAS